MCACQDFECSQSSEVDFYFAACTKFATSYLVFSDRVMAVCARHRQRVFELYDEVVVITLNEYLVYEVMGS
jgi:hypothetical protein